MKDLDAAIIRDLNRELATRTSKTVHDMIALADTPADKFRISLGAVTTSIAIAGAAFSVMAGEKGDPLDVGIRLLQLLKERKSADDIMRGTQREHSADA